MHIDEEAEIDFECKYINQTSYIYIYIYIYDIIICGLISCLHFKRKQFYKTFSYAY